MLNLADMSVPTQSNGKVDFLDLSVVKQKAIKKALEKFQLKYVKEVKDNTPDKHNFVLDNSYFAPQTIESFWVVGKYLIDGEPKAFMIQSLDGKYGIGKNIMRVWRGIGCSKKITSSAIHTVLKVCNLLNDSDSVMNFNLKVVNTTLENCNVFQIENVVAMVETEIEDVVTDEKAEEYDGMATVVAEEVEVSVIA